jgi:ribosomal protein L16 Arg81 hydroxylase
MRSEEAPPQSGVPLISRLLGDITLERFLAEHYLTTPLTRHGKAAWLVGLGGQDTVTRLIEQSPCDLVTVRNAHLGEHPRPRAREAAQQIEADGYSLVFRHAERHVPELARLAGAWADVLHGTIDLHLYCTPAGFHSFGWHYDAEEVFIIQTGGSKDYYLRRNTIHPDPLLSAMPVEACWERETSPVITCHLAAGDWLYIPGGWWHVARARERSLSLSIGVMPVTPMEIFDALRVELIGDPAMRRRLPPAAFASLDGGTDLVEGYAPATAQIAQRVREALSGPFFLERFLTRKRRQARDLMER